MSWVDDMYLDRRINKAEMARVENRNDTYNAMAVLLGSISRRGRNWITDQFEMIDDKKLRNAFEKVMAQQETKTVRTGSKYESLLMILFEYYGIKYIQEYTEVPGLGSTIDFVLPEVRCVIHVDGEHHNGKRQQRIDEKTDACVARWIDKIEELERSEGKTAEQIVVVRIKTSAIDKLGWDSWRIIEEAILQARYQAMPNKRLKEVA